MTKAQAVFEKVASIYGGAFVDNYIGYSPSISFDANLEAYKQYLQDKAVEKKTSYPSALLRPGLSLGAVGGLIGGVHRANTFGTGFVGKGVAVGSAIGAGLGVLLGLIAKKLDDGEIDEAKKIIESSNMDALAKKALIKELEGDYQFKELSKEMQHREMMRELKKR